MLQVKGDDLVAFGICRGMQRQGKMIFRIIVRHFPDHLRNSHARYGNPLRRHAKPLRGGDFLNGI